MLRVLEPGMFTTVQDLGRRGTSWLGVPPGGAADSLSLRLANRAVGNPLGAAGLEITLTGAKFEVLNECVLAVGGAECSVSLAMPSAEVRAFDRLTPIHAPRDSVLTIGGIRSGCRTYLAIRGGLDVRPVLGSASTLPSSGFGGWQGRPVRAGDQLARGAASAEQPTKPVEAAWRLQEHAVMRRIVRIVPGLQYADFEHPASITGQLCTISNRSDRMGLRIEGLKIASPHAGRMPSQPMIHGAIQVPPSGEPIVLMCDHPTTGGYPVIGCVIAADLPVLGQLRPGDRIQFEWIELDKARQELRRIEALMLET